ncbi:hypothetical protein, partial [Neisseria gonorrhoeae]|uniref:hypothetical protein n=1 Tax=Neisseria gonorrhoeae TaxID=485 RepID=UPI00311E5A34
VIRAKSASDTDSERWSRLAALAVLILATIEANREDTEWEYITWTVPPHWRHTEVIPDTEENES